MKDLEFEEDPSEFLRYGRCAKALFSVFMQKKKSSCVFCYTLSTEREVLKILLCFAAGLGNSH